MYLTINDVAAQLGLTYAQARDQCFQKKILMRHPQTNKWVVASDVLAEAFDVAVARDPWELPPPVGVFISRARLATGLPLINLGATTAAELDDALRLGAYRRRLCGGQDVFCADDLHNLAGWRYATEACFADIATKAKDKVAQEKAFAWVTLCFERRTAMARMSADARAREAWGKKFDDTHAAMLAKREGWDKVARGLGMEVVL